jgi:hypothetical protein
MAHKNTTLKNGTFRTVWSIIQYTPEKMLEEIVLIDDGSNSTEITHLLPLYLKHRLANQVSTLKKIYLSRIILKN